MKKEALKLDKEEFQILQDFERGEFESIRDYREEREKLKAATRRTRHFAADAIPDQ